MNLLNNIKLDKVRAMPIHNNKIFTLSSLGNSVIIYKLNGKIINKFDIQPCARHIKVTTNNIIIKSVDSIQIYTHIRTKIKLFKSDKYVDIFRGT